MSAERIPQEGTIGMQQTGKAPTPIHTGVIHEFHGMSPTERDFSVAEIRHFVQAEDYDYILDWASDPTTRGHLDPAPPLVTDWTDINQVTEARAELERYYNNDGEPEKIHPMVAVNYNGEPVGVLTIRWRGDKFAPQERRIASIERMIVNPRRQGKKIGTKLLDAALNYAFNEHTGYKNNQPANEVRAWVMTDEIAGEFSKNLRLLQRQGFSYVQGNTTWSKYKAKYGLEDDGREALWLKLEKNDWLNKKNGSHAK